MPHASDDLMRYIEQHERAHGPIAVPAQRASEGEGEGDAQRRRPAGGSPVDKEGGDAQRRQSVGGSPREWGVPVAPQAGATSAKVALSLGSPQASPERGQAALVQQPVAQQLSPPPPAASGELAPTPPRESKVVAAARIALASPARSLPTEVLLGAYRWQRRAAGVDDDDFTWNSSAANLMGVLGSPVSAGSRFASPLADMSTEDEAVVRGMTHTLSRSDLLTSTEPSVVAPAETSSSRKQRQQPARRTQRIRAKRATPQAPATSDSSGTLSSGQRSASRHNPRRQAKLKSKLAQERAAKIRAIVKDVQEDRMLRPDLRCSADNLPQQKASGARPTQIKKPAKDAKSQRPAAHQLKSPRAAPKADLRTLCEPADPSPVHTANNDTEAQSLALPLRSSVPAAPSPAGNSSQMNETQLEVYHTIGELRDRRDSILRSCSEDYYIQQACGPDPYIDRLVATVLALPRPQLLPPEDCSSTLADVATPQAAPSEALLAQRPEKSQATASVEDKAVLTQACTRDEKGVQTTVDSTSQQSPRPRSNRTHSSQFTGKRAQHSAVGGEEARKMRISSSSRRTKPGLGGVRRPLPRSPRKCGEDSCRNQRPQSTDVVELRIVTSSSLAGNHSTTCSNMTGVVDRMPVGPNAFVATAGRREVLHAVQRTHSTPPRRKSGHRKEALQVAAATACGQKPKQPAKDPTMIDSFVELAKSGDETSRLAAGEGSDADAGNSPLSVSLTSSSDGESALVSPARRFKVIEARDDSDVLHSQLPQMVSRDSARAAFAAMDSFSPVASSTSCSPNAAPADLFAVTSPEGDLAGWQDIVNSGSEPEPESTSHRWNDTQQKANSARAQRGDVPVGEPAEALVQVSPGTTSSSSLLSPTSLQQVSGCSEAISVPSEPGQEIWCLSQVTSPLQHTAQQKLAVNVAGFWKAMMKEIVPKSLPAHKAEIQATLSLDEPPAGSDLEQLYAQHQRMEATQAGEVMSVQTQCCFELQQLGDDFVTGYHAQSSEPFYIRDGRISYAQQKAKLPSDNPLVAKQVATLSFLQVFPDNGECKWSAQVELSPPAAADAPVSGQDGASSGKSNGTDFCMGLALRGGRWSRSGGHLGSAVRQGTFEAWRCTDQHEMQGDSDVTNHSGDTNDSLEQSSLSFSFSSNASSGEPATREMQQQVDLSSDTAQETAERSTEHADGTNGQYNLDDSVDDLSSVSMQTILASLAKMKETLVQRQSPLP